MTAEQLRQKFNDEFAFGDWPDHYEVDAETYGNVCQQIFDESNDDIALYSGTKYRRVLSFGINNGLMFKNVELILKVDKALDSNYSKYLTLTEIGTMYRLFKYQYISYEDPDAIALVRKLGMLVDARKND